MTTGTDKEANLPFWQWQSQGISVRLVQRLPDQTRGYFMARKFSKQHAEILANNCVFQTIFRNTAKPSKKHVIEYDLRQWRIVFNGEERKLKVKEHWLDFWQKKSISQSSLIALEWSLLPTQQRYLNGDYNWGMTSFGLKPGQTFNLNIIWHDNGEKKAAQIPNIQCAPDIHPDPSDAL